MTRPVFSRSLLARQSPEVRAILAKTPRPKHDAGPSVLPSLSASLLALNPHLRDLMPTVRRTRPEARAMAVQSSRAEDRVYVEIPGLALKLSLNSRVGWAGHARIVRHERDVVRSVLAAHAPPSLPCVVTITRVGPREMNDDNATSTCKGTRDEVAAWLQTTDEDLRVTWAVKQERGPTRVIVTTHGSPGGV